MPDNRILYIEDDAQHRRVIRTILSHEGYTILEADNGCWGLAMAEQERPALIVMDIRLPQMDGLDVVRCIRRTPHLARTPIIAVTANAVLFSHAEYLQAGCDEVIFKPFQLNDLVESIDWLLSQANKCTLQACREVQLSRTKRLLRSNKSQDNHIETIWKDGK
jgi:two-component system, cell cycle response regulator DivK